MYVDFHIELQFMYADTLIRKQLPNVGRFMSMEAPHREPEALEPCFTRV